MSLPVRTALATGAKATKAGTKALAKTTAKPAPTAPAPTGPFKLTGPAPTVQSMNAAATGGGGSAMVRPDLAEANGILPGGIAARRAAAGQPLFGMGKPTAPVGPPLTSPTTPAAPPFVPASTPAVLPEIATPGVNNVNMDAPIPNASGAGAQTGVPAWQTLLGQMPQFGGSGGNSGNAFSRNAMPQQGGLFGGQGPGQIQQMLANLFGFGNINMNSPTSQASSVMRSQGPQGLGGPGGPGMGASITGGNRIGGNQVPALGQGGGMGNALQQLMQQLQGGNQTRFQNTFGGASQFPFAQFLGAGGGFASPFNPMSAMRAFQSGGLSSGMGGGMGGFGGGQLDPRARDMRQQLLGSLFGGGGPGAGGGLDVN